MLFVPLEFVVNELYPTAVLLEYVLFCNELVPIAVFPPPISFSFNELYPTAVL